ncbi:unnamed protein product [Candidula unifasciata]|uniref:Uncharacterized protein n=1 Tax=Candidula unifasciata TaxID=100452 RepID=A0A8S3ZGU6_9EUPU|nr:unnamed protein product [Candidula unifasciata]
MPKPYRGVQALPSFHQDFKFNRETLFQKIEHDPQRPYQKPYQTCDLDPQKRSAYGTSTPPERSDLPQLSNRQPLKMGSQARRSYLPPINLPAAPAETIPAPPTTTYPRAPEQKAPSAFRNEATSRDDLAWRRQSRMGAGTMIAPDPRFGTDNIKSLNLYNFLHFHRGMEKSLVMFYTTPGPDKDRLKQEFETAADRGQEDGYGFGAVDCFTDNELCCRENVCKTPMLKLYSNGFQVSAIQDPSTFTAYQMDMLMRHTPVLTQPKAKVSQQLERPVPRIIMGTRMLNR